MTERINEVKTHSQVKFKTLICCENSTALKLKSTQKFCRTQFESVHKYASVKTFLISCKQNEKLCRRYEDLH